MTDRRGVILLFFDLPMTTKNDRREYNRFRKELKRNGFINIQESVMIKLVHNTAFCKIEILKVKNFAPKTGAVYALPICLSNFEKLQSLSDKEFDFEYFTGNVIFL